MPKVDNWKRLRKSPRQEATAKWALFLAVILDTRASLMVKTTTIGDAKYLEEIKSEERVMFARRGKLNGMMTLTTTIQVGSLFANLN